MFERPASFGIINLVETKTNLNDCEKKTKLGSREQTEMFGALCE